MIIEEEEITNIMYKAKKPCCKWMKNALENNRVKIVDGYAELYYQNGVGIMILDYCPRCGEKIETVTLAEKILEDSK